MANATVLRVIVPDLEPYISYNGISLFGPYGVLLTAFAVWAKLTLKIDYQQCKTSSNYAKCRLVGPDGYPTVGENYDLNMYPAIVGSYNKDLAITPTRNSVCLVAPRGSLINKKFSYSSGCGTGILLVGFYVIVSYLIPRERRKRVSLINRLGYTVSQSGDLSDLTKREKFALLLLSIYWCYILSQIQNALCSTVSLVRYNNDIKTLKEVENAGLTVMVPESYKSSYSRILQAHQNRFRFRFYNRSEFRFYRSDCAHLLSCYDAQKRVQLDSNLDRRTFRRIMAIVPERFHTGFVGLRFRKECLVKKRFELFFRHFFETGLTRQLTARRDVDAKFIPSDEFEMVTFVHVIPIVMLLLWAWMAGAVIFVWEFLLRPKVNAIAPGHQNLAMARQVRSESEPAVSTYKASQIVCKSLNNGYLTD